MRSAPKGEVEVQLIGRPFRIKREFLDDVAERKLQESLAGMRKALLIFHSPTDAQVGIDNASQIFTAARHPKSFVSLAGADHLLSKKEDAAYVADVIAAWVGRYLDQPANMTEEEIEHGLVLVRETHGGKFQQEILSGPHRLLADEPVKLGGLDSGPGPYDFVLAGLGACTSMTIRLYADVKKIPLENVSVRLHHDKIHAKDCESCDIKVSMLDHIEREITLEGPLDAEQRQRLMEIADKCPVHKTLESKDRHSYRRAAGVDVHSPRRADGCNKPASRHAPRRARADAAIPRLGRRGAAQLCRRRSLAAQLPASVDLGGRDFRRPGPLRERRRHETVAADADAARPRAARPRLTAKDSARTAPPSRLPPIPCGLTERRLRAHIRTNSEQ